MFSFLHKLLLIMDITLWALVALSATCCLPNSTLANTAHPVNYHKDMSATLYWCFNWSVSSTLWTMDSHTILGGSKSANLDESVRVRATHTEKEKIEVKCDCNCYCLWCLWKLIPLINITGLCCCQCWWQSLLVAAVGAYKGRCHQGCCHC